MSKETYNSLINLGDLSKPANTLIEKVSDAVGGWFAPYQIKRFAKAEMEAALIKAQSEIEITDLHRRTAHRFIEEEAQRQKNMEDITAKAVLQLDENAKPDSIENDWLINFFDKCRIVSGDEMQALWSRVLAGEANAPGTYSKRTVNFLSDLDKYEAEIFTQLCGFVWIIHGFPTLLIFNERAEIYNSQEIHFGSLRHLDSIGLIQFGAQKIVRRNLPKRFSATYYDRSLTLEMPNDSGDQLILGTSDLTLIGQELVPICGSKPVDGFWEYVKDQWKQYLPKPKTE